MIKDFKRAASVEDAVRLSNEGYVFLAGGTQVNNTPYKKWGKDIEKVVSLDSLNLKEITKEGDILKIGALVTLQELADSPLCTRALKDAARFIPTRSVRNIATIGGNVGAGRPDSYIIPVLIAYDAAAILADGTSVSVEKYIHQENKELILEFSLPHIHQGIVKALKESRSQLALPVVSAAVSMKAADGRISNVIIAAGCVSSRCIRLSEIEKGLLNGFIKDGPELENSIAEAISPKSDILGSGTYKTYINSVRFAETIRTCYQEVLS